MSRWLSQLTCGVREAYYTGIKDDPELHVKLSGSWETIIGEQDVFCGCLVHLHRHAHTLTAFAVHILEYENYSGYDKTTQKIKNSEV